MNPFKAEMVGGRFGLMSMQCRMQSCSSSLLSDFKLHYQGCRPGMTGYHHIFICLVGLTFKIMTKASQNELACDYEN